MSTPQNDPIVSVTSPTLTPFGDSDFLLFEEADSFLGLEDDPDSSEINPFYYDPEEDILLLEAILNSKPSPPPPNKEQNMPSFKEELKAYEAQIVKSSVDEPPEVELKDLPHHLEYAFLEGDNKLPVIIAKELGSEEKADLIKVLKSHKRAIAWKLSDIQGINPEFCTHKILMEEDYKPTVQHQRRVNPKIHDVIKKEVEKILDARLIYPISDSPWVSPIHCVPIKGGFTVVENEENELIPTRLVTGWRVCIDYCKLNKATRKDHFPLQFMDQMLERLARNEYYCFLDGFSGIVHTDHSDLKYLFAKKDDKARLLRKLSTFSRLAIMDPRGDIMVQISLPKRSLIPVSSGPPFIRMPTCLLKIVTRANDKENFHNEIRCLKNLSKLVKSLTFGALILWARSRLYEGTSIFLWRSTTYQNGLKRKRSPPTMPVLFANSSNLSSPDLVHLELS
nr:reverse transcriptase domain-containing protein [Tanacetum cinerariifolium]